MHGPDGLKDISQYAVLNANYLLARLRNTYRVPFDRICMHEFVAEGQFEGSDVRALDIAKRLMDYNFHPPTNYFPAHRHEALMIEPTETENKDTLDAFADALIQIAEEAKKQPELLHNAPSTTQFGRHGRSEGARELVCAVGCRKITNNRNSKTDLRDFEISEVCDSRKYRSFAKNIISPAPLPEPS